MKVSTVFNVIGSWIRVCEWFSNGGVIGFWFVFVGSVCFAKKCEFELICSKFQVIVALGQPVMLVAPPKVGSTFPKEFFFWNF